MITNLDRRTSFLEKEAVNGEQPFTEQQMLWIQKHMTAYAIKCVSSFQHNPTQTLMEMDADLVGEQQRSEAFFKTVR